tara:strand:+ start:5394 stop:5750 length:357 start_codon:yes stop_codon:yes gene_type:complete
MNDYKMYNFKGLKGLPTKIIYDTTKGRKRKPPFKYIDNIQLKEKIYKGKPIKNFTIKEKQTYDRLAQRKTYQKNKMKEKFGVTAGEYKKNLNKQIKDFTQNEKRIYNKLSKQEERLKI